MELIEERKIKPKKTDPMDDKWEKAYGDQMIGRVLKQEPQEYNKPAGGRKPLIRFPVYGILRWV